MFSLVFVHPSIAPNTGNAIRLAAATGVDLHLVGPMGFDLSDAKLRRAGLDYHDLANVFTHESIETAWPTFDTTKQVFAFTAKARKHYTEVQYQPGDILIFGNERHGLPEDLKNDNRVTECLTIPMLADRRSLNLSNCAALVVYEAWRQNGFQGSR